MYTFSTDVLVTWKQYITLHRVNIVFEVDILYREGREGDLFLSEILNQEDPDTDRGFPCLSLSNAYA